VCFILAGIDWKSQLQTEDIAFEIIAGAMAYQYPTTQAPTSLPRLSKLSIAIPMLSTINQALI